MATVEAGGAPSFVLTEANHALANFRHARIQPFRAPSKKLRIFSLRRFISWDMAVELSMVVYYAAVRPAAARGRVRI